MCHAAQEDWGQAEFPAEDPQPDSQTFPLGDLSTPRFSKEAALLLKGQLPPLGRCIIQEEKEEEGITLWLPCLGENAGWPHWKNAKRIAQTRLSAGWKNCITSFILKQVWIRLREEGKNRWLCFLFRSFNSSVFACRLLPSLRNLRAEPCRAVRKMLWARDKLRICFMLVTFESQLQTHAVWFLYR